ncbi:hypothetical protein GA076_23715 [Vibrio parahaemolyticus]|nr:hypothetical protein [Vibrio parahaemolyticus]EIO4605660.1 hypothetical protein [Vibrio parahaemolyticus]
MGKIDKLKDLYPKGKSNIKLVTRTEIDDSNDKILHVKLNWEYQGGDTEAVAIGVKNFTSIGGGISDEEIKKIQSDLENWSNTQR